MMRRCLYVLLSLLFCSFPVSAFAAEITISTAISLKAAFGEFGKLYEEKYGTKIIFNFGASGDLTRQIEGGAPVDVFASASQQDMDEMGKRGFLINSTRANLAGNGVVLVMPADSKTPVKSFEDLKSAAVKKIAVGNPKTVPAGRYAAEVLDYYKLSGGIKGKLVFTENARQALDYVIRGEVDAGIVYATDAAVSSKDVRVVAVAPENSHKPVVYPLAVVKGTKNEAAAKAFVSLALSPEGAKILEKYGFRSVR